MRSFDVLFYLSSNKRLSKEWWGWWFETPSRSLWRHRNDILTSYSLLGLLCGRERPHQHNRWITSYVIASCGYFDSICSYYKHHEVFNNHKKFIAKTTHFVLLWLGTDWPNSGNKTSKNVCTFYDPSCPRIFKSREMDEVPKIRQV